MIESGEYFIISGDGHPLKVQRDGKVHAAHDRPDRHSRFFLAAYADDHARLFTGDGRLAVQSGEDLLVVGDAYPDLNSWKFRAPDGSVPRMGRRMVATNPWTDHRIRVPHGGGWITDERASYVKVLPHEAGAREGLTFLPWAEAATYRRAAVVLPGTLPTRIEDMHARVVGGGETRHWWGPDRWHSESDDWVRDWLSSPWNADANSVWLSLCTSHRPEMRSIPFDATRRENINRVKDKLALINELGYSPVIELMSQEFVVNDLGKDPARVRDYIERLGATYVVGNTGCLLTMPTREVTELRWGGNRDTDVEHMASWWVTAERACNDGSHRVMVGMHLRSTEPPADSFFRWDGHQMQHALWLGYDDFYQELSAPVRRERKSSGGGHEMHTFVDVPEYYRYWDTNRAQTIPNWNGMVWFEFGIPDTVPFGNWGPGHSLEEVRRRGEIMRTGPARADLAMGVSYV